MNMTRHVLQGTAALLSSVLAAAPPLPLVDPDVKPVTSCSAALVSFRNERDGWLTACEQLLRTQDGGRSWSKTALLGQVITRPYGNIEHLTDLIWLSADKGLAMGHGAPAVLRTEDGGQSWKQLPLPVNQWPYDVEAVGERVWMCGSSGRILRSDDAGLTWKDLPGTPFNGDDRCMTLSFLDANDGWAGGADGSLWRSSDGGDTWERMSAPPPPPQSEGPGPGRSRGWRELMRITPLVAWAELDSGRFRTTDGGKTWEPTHRLGELKPHPVVVRQGARLPWVAHSTGGSQDPSALEPLMNKWAPWGEQGVVSPDLAFFQAGVQVRNSPPLSAGGSSRVQLQGLESARGGSWGWAGPRTFRSYDGETWFAAGSVPAPVTRIAALDSGVVLARTASGDLFRSGGDGGDWTKTESPLDARDFALSVGEPAPKRLSPECVLSARPATLTVHFGMNGCFGGSESQLKLELQERGASAKVKLDGGFEKSGEKFLHSLSRQKAEAAARALVQAALRDETETHCHSTSETFATLEWSCGEDETEVKGGPVRLSSHDCDPSGVELGNNDDSREHPPNSYSRAIGVAHEAERIAQELLDSR